MSGIQIGGIASGMDTAAMVEAMMAVQRVRVDRVFQQKVRVGWQQEALVGVSNTYANFVLNMRDTFGISNSVSTHGMTRPGAVSNLSWVNRAVSSNNSVVTARASTNAARGRHQLEVHQVADSFRVASQGNVTQAGGSRDNLASQLGIEKELTFTLGNGTETIEIKVTGDMTMDELVQQMNQIDGVTASYDATLDRFFLQTTETGADQQVIIAGEGAEEILQALNLNMGQPHETTGQFVGRGQNALIDFNGAKGIEFSSNQFNIQGIDFSLHSASVGEIITVTVETDVDSVFDKVMAFVNEYNAMILEINQLLTAPVNRDFPPLTDDQRAAMTEREIEVWEEKAKSGILRNDSTVNSVQQQLRSAMMQNVTLVDGTVLNLHSIGIQGVSLPTSQTSGTLQVNEEQLRAAIAENPEGVLQLFFAVPNDPSLQTSDRNLSASQIQEKRAQSGIFNRLTDIVSNGISQIISRAGDGDNATAFRQVNAFVMTDFVTRGSRSLLDDQIKEFNRQITTLNNRLSQVEARYWRQFTAMEAAIAGMNNQQNALFNMWM